MASAAARAAPGAARPGELPPPKNSAHASVATLLNSAIGAGVLSLPYAYSAAGWAGGLISTLVIASIEAFTLCEAAPAEALARLPLPLPLLLLLLLLCSSSCNRCCRCEQQPAAQPCPPAARSGLLPHPCLRPRPAPPHPAMPPRRPVAARRDHFTPPAAHTPAHMPAHPPPTNPAHPPTHPACPGPPPDVLARYAEFTGTSSYSQLVRKMLKRKASIAM